MAAGMAKRPVTRLTKSRRYTIHPPSGHDLVKRWVVTFMVDEHGQPAHFLERVDARWSALTLTPCRLHLYPRVFSRLLRCPRHLIGSLPRQPSLGVGIHDVIERAGRHQRSP